MTDDPFLNYLVLSIRFLFVIVLFYGIIAIHDILRMRSWQNYIFMEGP